MFDYRVSINLSSILHFFFELSEMESYLFRIYITLCILFVFHVSEFIIHKKLHPKKTNINNFLITKEYLIGQLSCYIIVYTQWYFIGSFLKTIEHRTSQIGISMIVFGLFLRIIAILQLGRNYAHYIYLHKNSYNRLVTNGIYKIMRHPCYNGFILFQVGIQFYLQNIVGVIVYLVVLDIFFKKRVTFEERMLRRQFPEEYDEYMSKVHFSVI